ncbi:hypothetical protein IW261DRAFT_1464216 [Armillaria novae-zelandiae]|uniref:Uncharacterized protein n=1 Tax=Armillaria novae-zelandiae TaxID=153914 RepID=A0AA39PG55_9AGAR|nr:hypothetical protein IW261DRAFT_1464216 [Armillaria novae-zelandiae]
MSKPIILARRRAESSNDTTVSKFVLAAQRTVGPYVEWDFPERFNYVPPPVYFCIRTLIPSPEQVHHLGSYTLNYRTPASKSDFDIIKALIPSYTDSGFTISRVDPRLWATLIQLYSTSLPDSFERYPIPLSDIYLPLLQQIPSTPNFTLITILELPDCEELADSSISELRHLSSLCALDASGTMLTDYGVSILSKTVGWYDDGRRRGPWPLRILRLRSCQGITHKVFHYVRNFPLLAVLDLRGTKCTVSSCTHPWSVSSNPGLYHPTPLRTSLTILSSLIPLPCKMFSSSSVFNLYVDTVQYAHPHGSIPKDESRPKPLISKGRCRETAVGLENTASTLLPHKKDILDSKDNVLVAQVAPEQLPARRSREKYLRGVSQVSNEDTSYLYKSDILHLFDGDIGSDDGLSCSEDEFETDDEESERDADLRHFYSPNPTIPQQGTSQPSPTIMSQSPATPLSVHPPDWMANVTAVEMAEQNAHHVALAFYLGVQRHSLTPQEPAGHRAEEIYPAQERTFRLIELNNGSMFYRTPPDWSVMENRSNPEKEDPLPAKRSNIEKATFKMDTAKARLMAEWRTSLSSTSAEKGLDGNKRRKLSSTLDGISQFQSTDKPASVNPFRRKKSSSSEAAQAVEWSHPGHLENIVSTKQKPTKPISTYDVPELPNDAKERLLADVRAERRRSLPSEPGKISCGKGGKAMRNRSGPSKVVEKSGATVGTSKPQEKAKFDMRKWLGKK